MIRKSLTVGLVALTLLALTGCGKNASPTPVATPAGGTQSTAPATSGTPGSTGGTTATTPAGTTAPAQKNQPKTYEKVKLGPLKTGDMAKIGPLEVTLTAVSPITKAAGLPQGYVYLLVNMTVKNIEGTDGYTINTSDHFKMTSPDGKNRSLNVQAMGQKSPKLSGTVDAGNSVSGWLGYMPKADKGNFVFQFVHPDWGEVTWEFAIQ